MMGLAPGHGAAATRAMQLHFRSQHLLQLHKLLDPVSGMVADLREMACWLEWLGMSCPA